MNLKPNTLFITSLSAYTVMIIINVLAGTTILGGQTTAAVSDAYPNLFAPAGFTFSIWGIIYLLLACFIVFLFNNRASTDTALTEPLKSIGFLFILTSVLNVFWLLAWQYKQLFLTVILMLLLLILLIQINQITHKLTLSPTEYFFMVLPFSIYFGWITVATIANITVFLVSIGFSGFGLSPAIWTMLILIIGSLIGLATMYTNRDIAYGFVFIWAYFGILSKHLSATGFNRLYPGIISLLVILILIFCAMVIYLFVRHQKTLRASH